MIFKPARRWIGRISIKISRPVEMSGQSYSNYPTVSWHHSRKNNMTVLLFSLPLNPLFYQRKLTKVSRALEWKQRRATGVWVLSMKEPARAQYLGLGQAQFGCQVCPLWQGEVLGLLEALVQRLELQAGVNGPRFPDLFAFPVKPHLPVLDHGRGFLVFWREESGTHSKDGYQFQAGPCRTSHTSCMKTLWAMGFGPVESLKKTTFNVKLKKKKKKTF